MSADSSLLKFQSTHIVNVINSMSEHLSFRFGLKIMVYGYHYYHIFMRFALFTKPDTCVIRTMLYDMGHIASLRLHNSMLDAAFSCLHLRKVELPVVESETGHCCIYVRF